MQEQNFKAISLMEKRTSTHYFFLEDLCIYANRSRRGEVTYVKCVDEGCHCNGKIANGLFVRTNTVPHSHEDNHEEVVNYEIAYERLRLAVKTDRRPIRQLHNEAIRLLSRDAAGMLSWANCHRTLERIRHALMPPCRSMLELENILEDEESFGYLSYGRLRDTRFYQGSVNGQLIFANQELITELPDMFDIFVDGTFGVVPFHGRQLLVILGELRNRPRPIIYALMNGSATEDYQAVFEFVRDGILSFDGQERTPISATCDFEQDIRLALVNVWPDIRVAGCFFHLCQAQRRYARGLERISLHLIAGSMHNKILLMFMRLALLPLDRVDAGFSAILQFIQINDPENDFVGYVDYFRRTWLGRFPKETWNVSDRERRTNNNLEGYNNRIKQTIPLNPSAWAFLDGLLSLAFDASSVFDSDVIRDAPPPVDRSMLSHPLKVALQELRNGIIDELGFLEKLSNS